jgi:hypothetical protein
MTIHTQQGPQQFFIKNDNGIRMTTRHEEIPYMTTSRWVRPNISWDPITIEVIDCIGQSSTHECFRDWMYSHSEGLVGRPDYKRTVELEKIDPVGSVIEKWLLNGTFITEMNHEIVYDREMSNMKVTLQFDNALLTL